MSAMWIALGLNGLVFSFFDWRLSLRPEFDALAKAEPIVRVTARVFGWAGIWIGVIPLVSNVANARLLIAALGGVIPGGILAAFVMKFVSPEPPSMGRYSRDLGGVVPGDPILMTGMALGSCLCLMVAVIVANRKTEGNNVAE